MSEADYITPESIEALYGPVGEVVLNWGLVEAAIINLLAVVYQSAGGKHLGQELPIAFKRRTKFLRLCARRIAGLAPFAAGIRNLMGRAKMLSQIRNAIIHGAITRFDPATGTYTFWMVETDTGENIHQLRPALVRVPALHQSAAEMVRLTADIHALTDKLMDAVVR